MGGGITVQHAVFRRVGDQGLATARRLARPRHVANALAGTLKTVLVTDQAHQVRDRVANSTGGAADDQVPDLRVGSAS
ncbi:hypothetical protein BGK55_11230 [Xanthomonas citri pv. malvacearum]|nr:hypothetical protein BGK55_11230 [Xanthomonas citri pv. malvacearum]